MHAPDPYALRLALDDLGLPADEPVRVRAARDGFLVRVPRVGTAFRLPAAAPTASAALATA